MLRLLMISMSLNTCILLHAQCEAGVRTHNKIDSGWKFTDGDIKNAQFPGFDDSGWLTVNLPHDASIYGPFVKNSSGGTDNNAYRPRRKGCYRKSLEINQDLSGKKVFLEFEGVYMASEVWINGHSVGRKYNGYTGFIHEITSYVQQGKNSIAVRYDNTCEWSSRWYTGEGIYRHVWLTIVNDIHIENHGTYIVCDRIREHSARVTIKTEVNNSSNLEKEVTLISEIRDSQNKLVSSASSIVPLKYGESYTYNQELFVEEPELWSIQSPHLYRAVSILTVDGKTCDSYETQFGIRNIDFVAGRGLLLNGEKIVLKGVNIHHDFGCLGTAAFDRAIKRKLDVLKEMGCNAIRLSHNPHATKLLDYCDEMGMLVVDEAFDKWTDQYYGGFASFEMNWEQDVLCFLRRDRNHPSVFLWSVGNEVQSHQQNGKGNYGVDQLKSMVDFVHSQEPSRKVTAALYPTRKNGEVAWLIKDKENSVPAQMSFHMDVVSVNYMSDYYSIDKEKYPQLIYMASETKPFAEDYDPKKKQYFPESCDFSNNHWFHMEDNVIGQFIWAGTDYLGDETTAWPDIAWEKTPVDICGYPRPMYYFIQSLYSEKPMVHIAVHDEEKARKEREKEQPWQVNWDNPPVASHWNWSDDADQNLYINVFTNCESIELLLNSKSLGEKNARDFKDHVVKWTVRYEPGEIVAIGKNDQNESCRHVLKTAKYPYKIVLEPENRTVNADGLDLSFVRVSVKDENDIRVPFADNKIQFTVSGAGELAGVANGNTLSTELFQNNERAVYEGTGLVVVRSTGKKGEIAVVASSEGLQKDRIIIHAE